MDDQILSQEEIDALLRGNGGDFDKGDQQAPNYDEPELTSMEKDALGEIGNITMGSSATTLSTLLGHKVSITTPQISLVNVEELIDEHPLPYVAIDVQYTKGIEGANLLIIGRRDSGIIVDLMMGGDGKNPPGELTELHLSGVSEAMNQMMGTAATSLATMLNRPIDISPPHAQLAELSPPIVEELLQLKEPYIVKVAFRMIVEGLIDSEIMQLLPVSFAKDLIGYLIGNYQQDELLSNPADGLEQEMLRMEHMHAQQPSPHTEPAGPQQRVAAEPNARESFNDRQPPQPSRAGTDPQVEVRPVQFAQLGNGIHQHELDNIGLIMDVPLQLTVELGRTRKTIKDILDFSVGTIIELDKLAGEPVDIMANGKLIAKGEVVVIDENFGVRVTDIVSPMERMKNLQ